MKKIEAFIRHEAFEPIQARAARSGFPSLSISEVKGSGRQKGVVEHYRGSTLTVNVRPKMKIECVVEDKDKGSSSRRSSSTRTGDVGDGKIFVLPVDEAIRIRTGGRARPCCRLTRKRRFPLSRSVEQPGPAGRPARLAVQTGATDEHA